MYRGLHGHYYYVIKNIGYHARLRENELLFRCQALLVVYFLRFARARAHLRALMTQKSCAVEMRNAILRNHLKVIPEFCIAHSYGTKFLRHQRAHKRTRKSIRDSPQTKLDSEIKALFLLNKHGDPNFLFYKSNENNIRSN